MAATRPHVVVHVAVSLDGATTGFEPDVGRFYAIAGTWREDVTLAGADTILAQEKALADAPLPGPAADGPLLAVVDGRGRVRQWEALRDCGHWSGVLALHAAATPPETSAQPVRKLVTGVERVDLAAALAALEEREGARVVRVDSGAALIGSVPGARRRRSRLARLRTASGLPTRASRRQDVRRRPCMAEVSRRYIAIW